MMGVQVVAHTSRSVKGKGKAHPLQAMQAQRGLAELRLLDFLTSALWDIPGTHFHAGLSRPPGHGLVENPVTRPGIDPGTVRLVALRLNHYATPGPYITFSGGLY
jgi:hypothetical protein